MIYKSEIERIAKGAGVYRNIPTAIRKGAFKHMVSVLAELKMALVIVNDEKIRRFESRWHDYENFGVMGRNAAETVKYLNAIAMSL